MFTAPPFTNSLPAASRLTSIVLSKLSPITAKTPLLGMKKAFTAGVIRGPSVSKLAARRRWRVGF
jgi:hypothetical protein